MKRAIVAVVASACLATSAVAADLPRKAPAYAPPPLPPPFSWTGFYLGLHAGWGWTNTSATVTSDSFDPFALDQNGNGVVGGLQLGYNWQFAPNWLVGIEGDFSGTGIRSTTIGGPLTTGGSPIDGNHIAEHDIRWLASIRGRVGYVADHWLFYVTGGGAWAGVDYTVGPFSTSLGFSPFTTNNTLSGWTAGGGVEYAFTNNWTAKLEYLFYDLDDKSFVNVGSGGTATTTWDRNQINVVRLGVNYKF